MVIKIAVCDDERIALEAICAKITKTFEQCGIEARTDKYLGSEKFCAVSENSDYDLVFLDIDMPGTDGISLAKKLREQKAPPTIVFVSSREEKVFDSFVVTPFRFVRKGRFNTEITEAVYAYIRERLDNDKAVTFRINKNSSIVNKRLNYIVYIESFKNNQYIHIAEEREPVGLSMTMDELEENFKNYDIIRVHKSYLVNMRYIRRIDKEEVLTTTGDRLLISRRKAQEVKKSFLKFLNRKGKEA